MQRICQDFLSTQHSQVLARDGGGYRKEVGHGTSKALDLNCRRLPTPRAHPAQVRGLFLFLHSLSWHIRPQNETDGRIGKPTEIETKRPELILYFLA